MNSHNTNICRICMNNDTDLINIFASTATFSSISTTIMACAPISVLETDTLPHTICTCCLDKLEVAYNFRLLCIQTDQTLRNSTPHAIVKQEQYENPAITSITEISSVLDDAKIKYEEFSYYDFTSNNDQISSGDDSDNDNGNDNDNDDDDDNGNDNDNDNYRDSDSEKDSDSTFSVGSNELSDTSYDSTKRSRRRRFATPLEANEDGYFHCDQCERKYKHKCDLRKHLPLHTDTRYHCKQCGKEFYNSDNLRRHMVVHQTERKHKCEYCGLKFKQRRNLQTHLTIHLNIRRFKCELCSQEFRLKQSLQNHHMTHTGERPFACDVCGKTYKRKYQLSVHHLQSHIGKRFKCVCGHAFITKRRMNIHMEKNCRKLSKK